MKRYIDADKLETKVLIDMARAEQEGKELHAYAECLFHLKTIPTADVVPRAEVAPKCAFAYDGETLEHCVQAPCPNFKTVEEIRAEVERLEKELAYWKAEAKDARADIFQSTQEIAEEIFADLAQYGICRQPYMVCLTEQEFEELKKKYGVE